MQTFYKNLSSTNIQFCRDMMEYKGRVESYSREVLRKESQIKELQGRIETGDGCEYLVFYHITSIMLHLSSQHSQNFL